MHFLGEPVTWGGLILFSLAPSLISFAWAVLVAAWKSGSPP